MGWVEDGDLWLFPDIVIAAVERLVREQGRSITLKKATLTRRLGEAGWLIASDETKDKGKVGTTPTWVNGKTRRVWRISCEKLLGLTLTVPKW